MNLQDNEKSANDIRVEAKMLLQKASTVPTKWSDIFNAIEMFRKKSSSRKRLVRHNS